MSTKSIKERAEKYAISISPYPQDKGATWDIDTEKGYIAGATEQDSIARAEERERCIKVAQEWFCYRYCKGGYNPQYSSCVDCDVLDNIRKAIEEK